MSLFKNIRIELLVLLIISINLFSQIEINLNENNFFKGKKESFSTMLQRRLKITYLLLLGSNHTSSLFDIPREV